MSLISVLFAFFFFSPCQADVSDDLPARVQRLEAALEKMASRTATSQDRVRTYFAESLGFGGFFEGGMTNMWGEDSPAQTAADSQRLGLNVSAELSSRIQMVSQVTFGFSYPLRNEHNNPSHGSALLPTERGYGGVSYGALLSQAYLNFVTSDTVHLQAGMGYVPFGQAFQVREPVLFNKRRGPQLIRTSGVTKVAVANPFWQGLNVVITPRRRWRMNAYTHTPLDHSGRLGAGGRLAFEVERRFTLGASYQTGYQANQPYQATGMDISFEIGRFGVLAEFGRNNTDEGTPVSAYLQPFVRLFGQKILLFVQADYLKNPVGETTLGSSAVADPYIKWEQTVGAVYQAMPNARLRFDYTIHDYIGERAEIASQNRDYRSVTLSAGASF